MQIGDVINKLLSKGLLVHENSKFRFEGKLNELMGGEEPTEKQSKISHADLLKEVMEKSGMPFRVTVNGYKYTVKASSLYAKSYIYNVIYTKKLCTLEEAITIIGNYYKTVTAPKTITNFFKEGLFELYLEEFRNNNSSVTPTAMYENTCI